MLHWARTVAAVTKPLGVLLGVGMYTFGAVGKKGPAGLPLGAAGDKRFPFRPYLLASNASSLDMLDVHVYNVPGWGGIAADLATSEWPRLSFRDKPIVMGEFGAWRENPNLWANGSAAAAGASAAHDAPAAALRLPDLPRATPGLEARGGSPRLPVRPGLLRALP